MKKKEKVSRQRLRQREQKARGLCMYCAQPSVSESGMCQKHLEACRVRNRTRMGCQPNPRAWVENKDSFLLSLLDLDWNKLGYKGVAKLHGASVASARLWARRLGITKVFVMPREEGYTTK